MVEDEGGETCSNLLLAFSLEFSFVCNLTFRLSRYLYVFIRYHIGIYK